MNMMKEEEKQPYKQHTKMNTLQDTPNSALYIRSNNYLLLYNIKHIKHR